MQLSDADLKALYRGAFLHDIGMLSIPDGILRKDGRLEPDPIAITPVAGERCRVDFRSQPNRELRGSFGARMPLDGPPYLSLTDLQLISDWIVEGAHDN